MFGNPHGPSSETAKRPAAAVVDVAEERVFKKGSIEKKMPDKWFDTVSREWLPYQADFFTSMSSRSFKTNKAAGLEGMKLIGTTFGFNFLPDTIKPCNNPKCKLPPMAWQCFTLCVDHDRRSLNFESDCYGKKCNGKMHVADTNHDSYLVGQTITPFDFMPPELVDKAPYCYFVPRSKGKEEWCTECETAPIPGQMFTRVMEGDGQGHVGEFRYSCSGAHTVKHNKRRVYRKEGDLKPEGTRGPLM